MSEKVVCELGSLCPVCNEKVLGFRKKDAFKSLYAFHIGKKAITVELNKLVPVVSLAWLEKEFERLNKIDGFLHDGKWSSYKAGLYGERVIPFKSFKKLLSAAEQEAEVRDDECK